MSFDVASAWAASAPRPTQPSADVFGLLLSNEATRQLEAVRRQNAEVGLALAQTGLAEIGSTQRQRMSLDAQQQIIAAQIAENAQSRRSQRRGQAMQFAGTALANALPALTQSVAPVAGVDPLALSRSVDGVLAEERARREARGGRASTFAAGILKSLYGG